MNSKGSAGFEKIVFTQKEYNSIFESRKIFDNYIDQINILDKDVRDQINQKQLPLLIKEHFYALKNSQADESSEDQGKGGEESEYNLAESDEQPPQGVPETLDGEKQSDPFEVSKEDTGEVVVTGENQSSNLNKPVIAIVLTEGDGNFEDNEKSPMENMKAITLVSKIDKAQINQPAITKTVIPDVSPRPKINIRGTNTSFIHSNISKIFKDESRFSNDGDLLNICFMLHGLEGSSYDMRNLRSALQIYCPLITFYLSEINEEKTNESILKMGLRFAQEVITYLEHYVTDQDVRISFIGHSLGGLIVRAALPHLVAYSGCFHSYVSLGTPHLGSIGDKFWVNTGMKLLSRMKNNQSLREMALEDEEGCLLKLSESEGLGWFKNIILIANYDDGYTPYESAKILYNSRSKPKPVVPAMAKNIYERLDAQNIIKICVHIPNLAKGFDVLVGRQAHVEILENNFLKHLLFSQIKEYF
jgi:hypothetical protein